MVKVCLEMGALCTCVVHDGPMHNLAPLPTMCLLDVIPLVFGLKSPSFYFNGTLQKHTKQVYSTGLTLIL